jgi:hypothetical protein
MSVVVIRRPKSPESDLIPMIGPGRLLTEAYLAGGLVLEKRFNRMAHQLGRGPQAAAQRIESLFVNKEGDLLQVAELSGEAKLKLERECQSLMKYALPYDFLYCSKYDAEPDPS